MIIYVLTEGRDSHYMDLKDMVKSECFTTYELAFANRKDRGFEDYYDIVEVEIR